MTALALLLSYLAGCIPTGLILGLALRHIDIREHGSKNIGATNTMRVLGKKLGAIALLGDMAKGLAAVLLFSRLAPSEYLPIACGAAAIMGHIFPVFLRFKGGKGVATGLGVFLALSPAATGIAALAFLGVVALTRMVSAASLTAAVTLAAATFALDYSWPLRAIAALIALIVIWRHRTNIQRILKGEESRL